MKIKFRVILILPTLFVVSAKQVESEQLSLAFVADCKLSKECFVQQGPDVTAGEGISDPACGFATYDGHKGWDIRLRSLVDIQKNIPVLAAADGVVERVRDGMPDKLVQSELAKRALKGEECGNGVFIKHADGIQTQYCHLKNQSVVVASGDLVAKGQRIASIGASGLAAFPHVHLTVFRGGKVVDPLTGFKLQDADFRCGDVSNSLMDENARTALLAPKSAILGIGMSDQVPDLSGLVENGFPPTIDNSSDRVIAWAWFINLEEGWRVRLRARDPSSRIVSEWTSDPLPSRKANYVAFSGRRIKAVPGLYTLMVEILVSDSVVNSSERLLSIE